MWAMKSLACILHFILVLVAHVINQSWHSIALSLNPVSESSSRSTIKWPDLAPQMNSVCCSQSDLRNLFWLCVFLLPLLSSFSLRLFYFLFSTHITPISLSLNKFAFRLKRTWELFQALTGLCPTSPFQWRRWEDFLISNLLANSLQIHHSNDDSTWLHKGPHLDNDPKDKSRHVLFKVI